MAERNVEEIRRKNIEENQRFLDQLRVKHVRSDFLKSARSIVRKKEETKKAPIQHEKVDRVTRYSLKVKSGEIKPYVPPWQRNMNQKKGQPSKWTVFYQENPNPYQRVYKPRVRK